MTWVALVRTLGLLVPVLAAVAVVAWHRGHRRRTLGAILAGAWNLPVLLGLNLVAARVGWWTFDVEGGTILGVPVDLLVAWCFLWGPLPALLFRRLPLVAVLVVLLLVDLALMPLCAPVVVLGPDWLVGEGVALLIGALPGLLLARWTRDHQHLGSRVILLGIAFSGLMFWVLPSIVLEAGGGSWEPLWQIDKRVLLVAGQLLFLTGVPALSAVQEFAERGGGTALPYDPPRLLIRSGPYAYLANPMQAAMALVLVGWGGLLQSPWLAAAGPMVILFAAGLASWAEGDQLTRRYGDAWHAYRGSVRAWWPRWRPYLPEARQPAVLYYARGCEPCEQLAAWVERRRPQGLELTPAQAHPDRDLDRITYEPGDGSPPAEGIEALARALEHVHLGWAYVSWLVRLPLVRSLAQLITDLASGGPMPVPRDDV